MHTGFKAARICVQCVLHGDLNKYNMVITPQGPVFIDFENSAISTTDHVEARNEERQSLASKLVNTSGAGRP
jgi:serine/threonine-protein kinase RIO1